MADVELKSTHFALNEKLRRQAYRAELSNPLILPPLIPPLAWAGNTAHLVGDIVVNGGNQYLCQVAGTSAASGGPSGLATRVIDNTVYWEFYGVSQIATASPLAPTVAQTTTFPADLNAGLATAGGGAYTVADNGAGGTRSKLRLYGSTWIGAVQSGAAFVPIAYNNGVSADLPYGRMEVVTDAAKIAIGFGNAGGYFRLLVDGQYINQSNYKSLTSGVNYVVIDFSSVGGKKWRRIAIELGIAGPITVNTNIIGVYVSKLDTVMAPQTGNDITAVYCGDSIDAGFGPGPCIAGNKLASRIGHKLGINDMWSMSRPGTGDINKAAGSAFYNYAERTPQIAAVNPQIVFTQTSTNDAASSSAQRQAAILATMQSQRAAMPNALLVRVGCWPVASVTEAATIEADALAAFNVFAAGDPNCMFIPLANDPDGPLLTGTGNNLSVANNGNQDFYISADGLHPIEFGTELIADRIVRAMRQRILPTI